MLITHAAILYPNGDIEISCRHYKIIQRQAERGIRSVGAQVVQGFIDSDGNFLTRDQAKQVAVLSGQIPKTHVGELYSEDLWPEEWS